MGYSKFYTKYQSGNAFNENDENYGRIWDNVDYIVSSGTDQFFVMTNVVLTPNQLRKRCPEDYHELPSLICGNERFKRKQKYITASKSKIRHGSKVVRDRNNTNWSNSFQNTLLETFTK